eukprot:SAG11_NODE_26642_length_342_cov_1.683128_1_plen_31_part_10
MPFAPVTEIFWAKKVLMKSNASVVNDWDMLI